jgi:phosphoribosylaminoimidazolecarboxamide formyltransferase / IMP cyclohydrolase
MSDKTITSALISVYKKDNLKEIASKLNDLKIKIYSTGGTYSFISEMGINVQSVEDLTGYPSILGGRVKTLHPKVFGGILARREDQNDISQLSQYKIPRIDLVIVDLYPFEETVESGGSDSDIIEKIDIGGISLIRAAAKNHKDVLVISHRSQYEKLMQLLDEKGGITSYEDRRYFAAEAFNISSHYDSIIFGYFNKESGAPVFKKSILTSQQLRYGENPHQKGIFYGSTENTFSQLHGKEISYNNLLDIDASIKLIDDFEDTTIAVIKHNNACCLASRETLLETWKDSLACDPLSAFGGVIVSNREIDDATASEIDKLFFEVIIAPGYSENALISLKQKKNRIILLRKFIPGQNDVFRSLLDGVLWQEVDSKTESVTDLRPVTVKTPSSGEYEDMIFANKIVKHSKSNAIVIAKNRQLCASGIGQTSRIDALKQAIEKARGFGFDLNGAVLASDAYFPFSDSVEMAGKAGIKAIIQPGGSVRDQESIDYCNKNNIAMVFTGIRHFKH